MGAKLGWDMLSQAPRDFFIGKAAFPRTTYAKSIDEGE
jgi:hypothetical protein